MQWENKSICHNISPVATPAIAAHYGLVVQSWTFSEVQVRSVCERNYDLCLSELLATFWQNFMSLLKVLSLSFRTGKPFATDIYP